MPVKRRTPKGRVGRVTQVAIDAYRRMKEIEAMDLPNGDDLLRAGGDYQRARYEVRKAIGAVPWVVDDPDVAAALEALREAADLPQSLLDEVERAKERKRERRRILEADYMLHGPHHAAWNQEKEDARFKEDWGVRAEDVDLSNLHEVWKHVYGSYRQQVSLP